MRFHLPIFLLITIVITSPFSIFAQSYPMQCTATMPISTPVCNLIPNPSFLPISGTYPIPESWPNSAFETDVQNWTGVSGSPDLNLGTPPPQLLNKNWAHMSFEKNRSTFRREDIAAQISPIEKNTEYVFSFFRAAGVQAGMAATNIRLRVVLVRCEDMQIEMTTFDPKPVPAISQTIYCETIIGSNTNWEQKVVTFTSDNDYNAIWFFVEEESITSPSGAGSYYIGYPELVKSANLVTIATNGGNCMATLTGCLLNAQFTWTDAAGNPWPGSSITINSQSNYGNFTVDVDFPNSIPSNNTCSNNITSLTHNFVVNQCIPCIPPLINSVNSTPGYYPVTQNSNGDYVSCGCNDCILSFRLTTNLSANIQWYRDGVAIPAAEGGNLPMADVKSGPYFVPVTVSVKDLTTGCSSTPVTLIGLASPHIFVTSSGTSPKIYTATTHLDYGLAATYQWQIDASVIPHTSFNQREIKFSFPGNIPPATYSDPFGNPVNTKLQVIVSNTTYPCLNGYVATQYFNLQKYSTSGPTMAINNRGDLKNILFYPNPVRKSVSLNAEFNIKRIEVFNSVGRKIKVFFLPGKILDLSGLASGIYWIKVYAPNFIESSKIVVIN